MYLFTVEGGDGSGKGLATQMIVEILKDEFTFTDVAQTAEPRRDAELGKLAVEAVRTGEAGPVREAVYFAVDRLDHSHTWIRPRLAQGCAVVSERNVHSSLVYQGIVGALGLEDVARINGAAMIPDLVIWVDCDPEAALRRIEHGTLRMASLDKSEYFETDDYQRQIRAGYHALLGGEVAAPAPFDVCRVVGPIVNDGTKDELREKIRAALRRFLHNRPAPLNIDIEEVESHLLEAASVPFVGQTTLDVVGAPPPKSHQDWLATSRPWEVIRDAEKLYSAAIAATPGARQAEVPAHPLHPTVVSVVGTLSLLPGAEVSQLRGNMGPVRSVTMRHTQRMLKFLHEQSDWVRQYRPMVGMDAPRSELRADWQAFGRLGLILWPLADDLVEWRREHPKTSWKHALAGIDIRAHSSAEAVVARLGILGAGATDAVEVDSIDALVGWWESGV